MMTLDQHDIEVKKLIGLESDLVQMIASTDDEVLMKKFLDWQTQRNVCNVGYIDVINEKILKEKG